MTDPVTANKAFPQPTRGSDVGSWDLPVNLTTTYLDALMGAGYTVDLTSSNVTLTQVEANNLYFILSGALVTDLTVSFPAIGGLFIISNQTTGDFTVTINTTAGGSTGVEIAQGDTQLVYLDGTNGHYAAAPASAIPSGTKMLFLQASAPTGWTQVTTYNDTAIRIVSGAGGTLNGSVGLSTFLSDGALAHTLALSEIPSHNHGVTDPGHAHSYTIFNGFNGTASGTGNLAGQQAGATTSTVGTGISIQDNGGGGSHTHAFAALQYLDSIICAKN